MAPHPFSEEGKRFFAGLYDEEIRVEFEAPLPRECRGRYVELEWDGLDGSVLYDVEGTKGAFHGGLRPLRLSLKPEGPLLSGKIVFPPQRALLASRAAGAKRDVPALFEPLRVFSRLPGCFFGWDWAPPLFPLGIKEFPTLRLATGLVLRGLRLFASGGSRRVLSAYVEAESGEECLVFASLKGGGGRMNLRRTMVLEPGWVTLFEWDGDYPSPWEDGRASALVTVEIDVFRDGERAASLRRRAGMRREPPELSAPRELFEEGPLQWGANYVEPFFPADESGAGADRLLETLKATGARWVRVWGGGRYAPESFLSACDRLGLNVWQDMPFACGCAPVELDGELYLAELREFLVRSAHHPSLAVICGGNENAWLFGSRRSDEEKDFFERVVPSLVRRMGGRLCYRPDSPWGGADPNDPSEGDRHEWGFWSGRKSIVEAAAEPPVFASEFGFQSRPRMPEGFPFGEFVPGQYQESGDERLAHYVKRLLGADFPLGEPYASRWCQAEALGKLVRMWMFSRRFRGGFVWQLNDVAPAVSWSLFDHFGVPKPAVGALAWAWRSPALAAAPGERIEKLRIIGGRATGGFLKLTFLRDAGTERLGLALDAAQSAGEVPVELPEAAVEARCCRAEVFLRGGGSAMWEWWNVPPEPSPEGVSLSVRTQGGRPAAVLEARRAVRVLLESDDCAVVPAQNPVAVFAGERRFVPLLAAKNTPAHVAAELLHPVTPGRKKP